jgi:hypothetical protein
LKKGTANRLLGSETTMDFRPPEANVRPTILKGAYFSKAGSSGSTLCDPFFRKNGFFQFFFQQNSLDVMWQKLLEKVFFRKKSLEKKGPFFAEEFFQFF